MSFRPVPCFGYNAGEKLWRGMDSVSADVSARSIKMFTYNILFDLMDETDVQHNNARVAHIISLVQTIVTGQKSRDQVVIVCLQEVTPRICRVILSNATIRRMMYSSASPNDTESVHPYGQLLLANNPFNCGALRFGKHKSVVSLSMNVNGVSLCGVGLHLTSNYSSKNDGASEVSLRVLKKRNQQLRACMAQAEAHEACFLMGDFNFGDDDADQIDQDGAMRYALSSGWIDCWPHLYPDDPGFTFDTKHNALAEHSARRPKRKRYDRILIKGPWSLQTARIVGRVPVIERAGQKHLPPWTISRDTVPPNLLSFDSLESMMVSQATLVDDADRRNRVIARGRALVEAAARQHSCEILMVTTIGSTFLGTALPTSDVDMVVIGTGERDSILGSLPSGTYVHEGVTVPIFKTVVEDVPLEIQYVRLIDQSVPDTPEKFIRLAKSLHPAEKYPLLAIADSLVVSKYASPQFCECFRFLKLWASRMGIYDGALGYFSGIALSVLLCRLLEENPQLSASALAISFFETYSEFDWWTDSISITGNHLLKTPAKDVMLVLSPSNHSICRNATLSTCARISSALRQAREVVLSAGGSAWTTLLVQDRLGKIPRFFHRHRLYVVVHADAASVGYLRSKIVGCIISMESNGWRGTPWPEPLESGNRGGICYVIGCDGDLHPTSLKSAISRWIRDCDAPLTPQICEFAPSYKKAKLDVVKEQKEEIEEVPDEEQEEEAEEAEFTIPDGKTAEEVYKRIKWDPECIETDFEIGYLDRFLGIVTIPVSKYKIGGKIPLHRIKFFRRRGVVVWSRGVDEEGNPWE